MQKLLKALLLPMLLALAGCEKYAFEEGAPADGTQQTGGAYAISEDTAQIDYLTVAQAQRADIGQTICVRGYIVASTTRSMKNADFLEPFEGSTAIVLADEPVDFGNFQYETDEILFPVCLTDYKDVRAALNLEDNPHLWNKLVFVYGVKASYMSLPGMKKVMRYQIVE